MIGVACPKPAIVHHETFDADFGGLLRQSFLSRFVHLELGCFPRIVENRARLSSEAARQNELTRETMQHPRGGSEAMVAEPAVERRSLQLLARLKRIRKIKRVVTAGHTDLLMRCLLHRKFPRTAPSQRAEPHSAALLIGVRSVALRCIDGKPWIRLVTCSAPAALQHFHARMYLFLHELRLACPSSVQVT